MAKFKDSAATQNFPTPDLLWTAVDFLKVGAEVGFWSFQRSGGQQVSLLQQVDWPQGLDLQLWHTTQPAEGCGQLRETREGLQRGTDEQTNSSAYSQNSSGGLFYKIMSV